MMRINTSITWEIAPVKGKIEAINGKMIHGGINMIRGI